MEKLNRAQKCSILGPQNLGSRGGPGPQGPQWIRGCILQHVTEKEAVGSTIQNFLPHTQLYLMSLKKTPSNRSILQSKT